MNIIRLLPVFLSSLLVAAHFLRSGSYGFVGCSLAFPFLLFFPQKWVARTVQICLLFAMFEWLRTLYAIASLRIEIGKPWVRLVIILGSVALFTGASACVFLMKALKIRYKLEKRDH